ncbi:MAG: hypothetical protein H7Y38_20530 [Armatimonadetes bacterium]|nr:hypothetical protein [Armatimonadota bacterium]
MVQITDTTDAVETLRDREARGEPLTEPERATLVAFYNRLESTEATLLAPAIERLRQERRAQEQTIADLTLLREEKRQRLTRIESLEAQEARLLSATRP